MVTNSDYIMHYGIKGMKWGHRRYQNKDGSLTTLGKSRRKSKGKKYSDDYERTRYLRRKSSKYLSNEELRTLNKRMNLEQEYNRLSTSTINRGFNVAKTLIGVSGTLAGLYGISQTPYFKAGKKILTGH